MIPVSLLNFYNMKDQFRCSLLTWDSGNKLLLLKDGHQQARHQ